MAFNEAVEAVVVMEDFADDNDIDTIAQLTGRCGKPGKSMESNVYMSSKTYKRMLFSIREISIKNAMIRTNFYLQKFNTQDSFMDIEKNPALRRVAQVQQGLLLDGVI